MRERVGLVLLSSNPGTKTFVDDVLAELAPHESTILLASAKACLAAVSGPLRRRLLIVDGRPADLSVGVLVEAVRLDDPELPILFVRDRWDGSATDHNRVRVVPGPLASAIVSLFIADALEGRA